MKIGIKFQIISNFIPIFAYIVISCILNIKINILENEYKFFLYIFIST